jgi:hyperosmotically inducible protein
MFKQLLKIVSVAMFALVLGACSSTATQRSTGEYTDDAAVTARVKLALINDPEVKAGEIQVATFRNVVQLSGFAESRALINRAVQVTRSVEGVKEVRNDIQVRARQ